MIAGESFIHSGGGEMKRGLRESFTLQERMAACWRWTTVTVYTA